MSDCAVCHGQDLGTTDGPDGKSLPVVCGACTPPPSVLELELDGDGADDHC